MQIHVGWVLTRQFAMWATRMVSGLRPDWPRHIGLSGSVDVSARLRRSLLRHPLEVWGFPRKLVTKEMCAPLLYGQFPPHQTGHPPSILSQISAPPYPAHTRTHATNNYRVTLIAAITALALLRACCRSAAAASATPMRLSPTTSGLPNNLSMVSGCTSACCKLPKAG